MLAVNVEVNVDTTKAELIESSIPDSNTYAAFQGPWGSNLEPIVSFETKRFRYRSKQ